MSRKEIEDYWENPKTVSLIDENLRIIETNAVLRHISNGARLLDVGCGDGISTTEYAAKAGECIGFEKSTLLYERANSRLSSKGIPNCKFLLGDALSFPEGLGKFDVIVTQRVIINFMTWEEQKKVIDNVYSHLRVGGKYIMIENTYEGFENLNSMRREMNLADIKQHDWHNHFLTYQKLRNYMSDHFTLVEETNFNLYYFLTRVFGNLIASFEGFGAGAQKDPIFSRIDSAAREIYERFGRDIKFDLNQGTSLGPIQQFVFQKTP